MPSLTADAVRALAPDAGALKAGQSLADPRHWSGLGHSERAAWGACKGSGKEPYAVSVDLDGPAAKCTCPSRKFPCKHGLALMFLSANGQAGAMGAEPEGVAAWLADRTRRASAAATRESGQDADEKTVRARERDRERRAAQREDRVADGMAEFRRWLQDLARRGLADVADAGAYEAAAARLVDAQAGELARDVRALARIVARDGVGVDAVLDRIGLLSLVAETYDRRDRLDPRLAAELRTRIGWTVREADLPEDTDIADRWFVVARRHEDDDRLRETRTWLRGATSGRWIVLLDFAPIRTDAPNEPPVGAIIDGRMALYPGASAVRGALRPGWQPVADAVMPPGSVDHAAALGTYATAVAADPFVERWPVAIDGVRIAWHRDGARFAAVDQAGMTIPARFAPTSLAALVAFAGGRPVTIAGEWDGHGLDVLAAGDGTAWVALPGTEAAHVPVEAGWTSSSPVRTADVPVDPAWAAVTAYATLGTGRGAPDPVLEPLLARMADRPAEDRLLALITALSVRRRVGRRSLAAPTDLPLLPGAPDEDRRRPPQGIALALREPVRRELRDQRLDALHAAGWIVPPELLPIDAMAPPVPDPLVLGHRAAWLARYLSGYRPWGADVAATDIADLVARLEDPETGAVERQALFRSYRQADPAAARAWLMTAWSDLSAPDKTMVAAMEVGCSAADVPFLEGLLEERNRERREVVASLLATIPTSGVAMRIRERGHSLVARKNRLQAGLRLVTPPDEVFTALEADGHLVATHDWKGGPARSAADRTWEALDWHLRRIEPRAWSEWLGLSVVQVVEELTRLSPHRWGLQPAEAIATAAVRFRDQDVARVLIDVGYPVQAALDDLWALLPAAERPDIAGRIMRRQPATYDPGHDLGAALRAIRGGWTPKLMTIAHAEIGTAVGQLSGKDRWTALARLRAFVIDVPVELLPDVVDRLIGQDADSRDIIDIAESRRRFAATVAEARGAA